MLFLSIILIHALMFMETDAGLDKEEYLEALGIPESAPPVHVIDVYKRQSGVTSQQVANLPIKSEQDAEKNWKKMATWIHGSMKDESDKSYTLDCLTSNEDSNRNIARIFCDPATILIEFEVNDCAKVPEVVKIQDMIYNQFWYHNIFINSVKQPRINRNVLRDDTDMSARVHYRCMQFKVHEMRDDEEFCAEGTTFNSNDWVKQG